MWRHTEYVTVWEDDCKGDLGIARVLVNDSPFCTFVDQWFRIPYLLEFGENGSGVALDLGKSQQVWGPCRVTRYDHRPVDIITGASNRPITDWSLAVAPAEFDGNRFPNGTEVMIVDVDRNARYFKTVDDKCPACAEGDVRHMDNYTSQRLPRCAKYGGELGWKQTIVLR